MLPLVKFCDKLTDACIRGLRGYDCARAFSYWIDELSLRSTHLVDFLVYGCGRRAAYEAAALEEGSTGPASRPSIVRARLFRRKYCMPRRRLVRQPDGALHWERLDPGESTSGSRSYHECDFPLASITEFGDGWVLYFWTLKMIGFVSVLAMLVMTAAWRDMEWRDEVTGNNEGAKNDPQVYGGKILSMLLSSLASAECDQFKTVCMNKECTEVGQKHLCPDPSPVGAFCCITVAAFYALFIMSLRHTYAETVDAVKDCIADDGVETADYSIQVLNPPPDATDPDEWYDFFKQFGKVCYVTVAKKDGPLVWKTLEPRQLILALYRDNPHKLAGDIEVVDDEKATGRVRDPSRLKGPLSSLANMKDIVTKKIIAKNLKADVSLVKNYDVYAGDRDAEGTPEDSLNRMAPWFTGGHLRLRKGLVALAEEGEKSWAASTTPLRLMKMREPLPKYVNPYIMFRFLRYSLYTGFPHILGTLPSVDRDMLSERLLLECPRDLNDEIKKLKMGLTYDAVKIFVVFDSIVNKRECLEALYGENFAGSESPGKGAKSYEFRVNIKLAVSEPPDPAQVIWWNLGSSQWRRFKDDIYTLFITFVLIAVAYGFAIFVDITDKARNDQDKYNESYHHPLWLRSFGLAVWSQVYMQMIRSGFSYMASQEHHHDEDAKQMSLLLRSSLLKCVGSIIFIVSTPLEKTLTLRSIVGMKTMLWGDAFVGPLLRHFDTLTMLKRLLARFLPNQPLMDWAHLTAPHDIAESYSNIVKTIFLSLFVLPIVPSAPLLTVLACLVSYWVDKHAIARNWSPNVHTKPAKYVPQATRNLLLVALVLSMMKTLQTYKQWPFDNLCYVDSIVARRTRWAIQGASGPEVYKPCRSTPGRENYPFARFIKSVGIRLWVTPDSWMSDDHKLAIRIYSVGSVLITAVLVFYFWGRKSLKKMCCNRKKKRHKNEHKVPRFSETWDRHSAYIPLVKDNSYLFPLLACDTSRMDSKHIPWHCNYELTNLSNDLGKDALESGLARSFSTITSYMDEPKQPRKTLHHKVTGMGFTLAERKLNEFKSCKLAEELAARKLADKEAAERKSSLGEKLSDRKHADQARRPSPPTDIEISAGADTEKNTGLMQGDKTASRASLQQDLSRLTMQKSASAESTDSENVEWLRVPSRNSSFASAASQVNSDTPTPFDALNALAASAHDSSGGSDDDAISEAWAEVKARELAAAAAD